MTGSIKPLLLAVITTATLLVGAVPASAHGVEGSMDIFSSRQVGADTIHLEISIPFSNDGEIATEAIVFADLTGPDDQVIDDVPLALTPDSTYTADIVVPVPGAWLVDLRSTRPVATATVEVVIREGAEAPTGDDDPDAGGTNDEATPDDPDERLGGTAIGSGSSEGDDVPVAALALGGIGALVVAGLLWRRRAASRSASA